MKEHFIKPPENGINQGGTLAPLLFTLTVNAATYCLIVKYTTIDVCAENEGCINNAYIYNNNII